MHYHKKYVETGKRFVVVASAAGINADMNNETTRIHRSEMGNTEVRGQESIPNFLFVRSRLGILDRRQAALECNVRHPGRLKISY